MNLIPHFGDCKAEIEKLRLLLQESQDQNLAFMRDLNDLTCRLRLATLKEVTCESCPKESVVIEQQPML